MRCILVVLAACGFHGVASTSDARDASDARDGDVLDGSRDAALDASSSSSCPAGYDLTLTATTSRYRVITAPAVFRTQLDACAADAANGTHLASLETSDEVLGLRDALVAAAATTGAGPFFIGAAQMPNASTTDGWFVFTGGPLPGGLWASGQPSDTGFSEQIANLAADLLHDATGGSPSEAVCECDGQRVDPTVLSYVP